MVAWCCEAFMVGDDGDEMIGGGECSEMVEGGGEEFCCFVTGDISIEVESWEKVGDEGLWLYGAYKGFKGFINHGGELMSGEGSADVDVSEKVALVDFHVSGVSC